MGIERFEDIEKNQLARDLIRLINLPAKVKYDGQAGTAGKKKKGNPER